MFAANQFQILDKLVSPALGVGSVVAIAQARIVLARTDVRKPVKGGSGRSIGEAEVRLQIRSESCDAIGREKQVVVADAHCVNGGGVEGAFPIQSKDLRSGKVLGPVVVQDSRVRFNVSSYIPGEVKPVFVA